MSNIKLATIISEMLEHNATKSSPLAYAIVHDLVHTILFGFINNRVPSYAGNLDLAGDSLDFSLQLNTKHESELRVVFLCQNSTRTNYLYPMLHALVESNEYRQAIDISIEIIFFTQAISDIHVNNIKNFITADSKNVTVSQTSFSYIMSKWIPNELYIDTLFQEVERIVKLDGIYKFSEHEIQDSVESVVSSYFAFQQFYSNKCVNIVYATNDQWYPMSSAFSASVSKGIKTVLSYHGTVAKFATFTYADIFYIYSQNKEINFGTRFVNGNVRVFEKPLDIFIFEVCHPETSALKKLMDAKPRRGSTIGIVSAISGDKTYSLNDYSNSLLLILRGISFFFASHPDRNDISIKILPHPSDSKDKYDSVYKEIIKKSTIDDDKINILYGVELFDFFSSCGPIIGCPSTGLDTLLYYGYPIKIVASNNLFENVFGYNPYAESVICKDEKELVIFLEKFLIGQ